MDLVVLYHRGSKCVFGNVSEMKVLLGLMSNEFGICYLHCFARFEHYHDRVV
ncbi:hypothetical protein RchiOBHm_Chr5g0041281 [Rosa chinensis]|uniref:Uncharacterized protein n=1 Tax=Rosa chinensis TaxID=74649 RepID=A0A2P6QCT0_ROSCH|nr:hypothetical protein RchiOBHm_Chr5g0041281 [Rosa chinensis]